VRSRDCLPDSLAGTGTGQLGTAGGVGGGSEITLSQMDWSQPCDPPASRAVPVGLHSVGRSVDHHAAGRAEGLNNWCGPPGDAIRASLCRAAPVTIPQVTEKQRVGHAGPPDWPRATAEVASRWSTDRSQLGGDGWAGPVPQHQVAVPETSSCSRRRPGALAAEPPRCPMEQGCRPHPTPATG